MDYQQRNEPKDLIGLSVVEDETATCGQCGEDIAHILVSETNSHRVTRFQSPKKSKFIIHCSCGYVNHLDKIYSGATNIASVNPKESLDFINTVVEDDGTKAGVVVTELRVVK